MSKGIKFFARGQDELVMSFWVRRIQCGSIWWPWLKLAGRFYGRAARIRQASNCERLAMLRFSIRDLLWLTAVFAMAALLCVQIPELHRLRKDNATLKKEHAAFKSGVEQAATALAKQKGEPVWIFCGHYYASHFICAKPDGEFDWRRNAMD